ncbi:hypothetical protein ACK344_11590, partial [Aeromonas veronii]
ARETRAGAERGCLKQLCATTILKNAGYTASQLSFHMALVYLIHELSCMPYVSPGNIPGRVAARPQKYAVQKANKNNASQA